MKTYIRFRCGSSGGILQHFGVFQWLAVTNIGDIHPLHAHPLIQASIELGPVDVVLVNTVSVLLHRQHLRRVVFVLLDHEHHQMGPLRGHGDFAMVRIEGNDGLRGPGVGVHDFLWSGLGGHFFLAVRGDFRESIWLRLLFQGLLESDEIFYTNQGEKPHIIINKNTREYDNKIFSEKSIKQSIY